MLLLLKDSGKGKNQEISCLIKNYLDDVKKTMMQWLNTVEEYYDERVARLERKLVK